LSRCEWDRHLMKNPKHHRRTNDRLQVIENCLPSCVALCMVYCRFMAFLRINLQMFVGRETDATKLCDFRHFASVAQNETFVPDVSPLHDDGTMSSLRGTVLYFPIWKHLLSQRVVTRWRSVQKRYIEIAQFTPSFTWCSQLNYTLLRWRMSSRIPVVVLQVEHKQSRISRPQEFKLLEPLCVPLS